MKMNNIKNFKQFKESSNFNVADHLLRGSRDVHYAYVQKIEDKIDNLLEGEYDDDLEILKSLEKSILKLSKTEKREKALNYIKNLIH